MKIARNFARGFFRAALGFERTDIAIQLAGPVEQCPTAMNRTAGSQHLAVGADVVAAPLVPVEVRAREGVVVAVALVAHRDVRGDLLVLDLLGLSLDQLERLGFLSCQRRVMARASGAAMSAGLRAFKGCSPHVDGGAIRGLVLVV